MKYGKKIAISLMGVLLSFLLVIFISHESIHGSLFPAIFGAILMIILPWVKKKTLTGEIINAKLVFVDKKGNIVNIKHTIQKEDFDILRGVFTDEAEYLHNKEEFYPWISIYIETKKQDKYFYLDKNDKTRIRVGELPLEIKLNEESAELLENLLRKYGVR